MALQGKTKVVQTEGGGVHIYIPADVRKDSQNPIHPGDVVMVTIDGDRLIVKKISATAPAVIMKG
jgi:bifunctional DNA-binding transcriptional regulator/antitoxin component of YhaV-PrlF toxin-antitoxin module